MYRKITFLALLAFWCFAAKATYQTVVVTGYNVDVVANGTGAANTKTTAPIDNDANEYAFMTLGYNNGTASSTVGLPVTGLINSASTSGLSFQLADYDQMNALQMNSATSGTLTLTTPVTAGELFLLGVTGNGPGTVDVTVNFATGPAQVFTGKTVPDWYDVTPFAIQGLGRVARVSSNIDNNTTNPRMYEIKLNIDPANFNNPIVSITVTRTSATGRVNIMGVSINTPCTVPANQATVLNLTPTTSQISGSFTAASSNPSGYLVVRYPAGSTPTTPVTATTYTAGQTLGTGTVVSVGTSTTFTATALFANTGYDFYVYTYNNTACGGGPLYNVTAPLMASATTLTCGGPANVTLTVGTGGSFNTLTDAITSLTNTGISGPVILELLSTYNGAAEPAYPIVFPFNPCISTTNTFTIRPAATAPNLVITSSNAGPTIDLNGASNIIIDGSLGGNSTAGASNLQIVNTNAAGAAIRFINDATYNTIKYCDLQGQNTSTTTSALSGVVYFSTAGANLIGNDNNTITYCNVHGVSAANPAIGIASYGTNTSAVTYNDNDVISYCNIYDYFLATASYGIKLDQGNTAWTIKNNNLYQTAARQFNGGGHKGMHINPNGGPSATMAPQGSGFIITDNLIGGDGIGGNTIITGNPATSTHTYMAMDISVGVGDATIIKNNQVKNINFSTANVSATTPNFIGININYGNVKASNNTIGDLANNGSLTLIRLGTSTTAGLGAGIRIAGGSASSVDTNTIAGITTSAVNATSPYSFVGVYATGGTTNSINGNIIGNEAGYNSINASTGGGTQFVRGIWVTGGTTTNIVNNLITRLNNAGTATGAQVIGIAATSSVVTATNNTIHDLTTTSSNTGGGNSAAALGIGFTSTAAGFTISGNKIYNLTASHATAAVNVVGIYVGGATSGVNNVSKNFIYRLFTPSTGASIISAFDIGAGNASFFNNMISLGFDTLAASMNSAALCIRGFSKGTAAVNNFYHNSVYIGGNAVGAGSARTFAFQRNNQAGADIIQNNIFMNARSNDATSTGTHYAISFGPTTGAGGNISGVNLNYNLYYVNGTGGVMGYTTLDVPAFSAGWVPGDNNSISANPALNEPINGAGSGTPDLHISGATPIEGAGFPIASVTDDFDGDLRSANSPTDIGADAGLFTPIDISAPAISYTALGNACDGNDRVLTATITDASGVATGGLAPRVYFRNGTGAWASTAGVLATGTTTNGTWNFTISSIAMGGVNAGNTISYYVIAQDINPTANIGSTPGGAVATNVNAVSTHPATPNTYVAGANLAGTYGIGTGGTFNTITSAVGVYNTCPVAGAVTFELLDATYPAETFPITVGVNTAASATNTLTIKPAPGVITAISGNAASGSVLRLNGANYVTIDGSNMGGTDQSLTISNTNNSTSTSSAAIQIASLGAAAGATNSTIKNCNISTGTTGVTTYGITIGGSALGSGGADNDNITIQNNVITAAAVGIYSNGTAALAAGGSDNLTITGNTITLNSTVLSFGIQVANGLNGNITQNTLDITCAATNQPVGISVETGFLSASVTRNNVVKVLATNTGGYGGRGITIGTGNATSAVTVANNIVYGVNGSNWNAFGNSSSIGIGVGVVGSGSLTNATGGVMLYNNSVNMYGTYGNASTTSITAALYVGSAATGLDIRNNIFNNSLTSSASGARNYALYSDAGAAAYSRLDYNLYGVPAAPNAQLVVARFGGQDRTTISALRTANTKDTSSVAGVIPFVSNTDLHIDGTVSAAWNLFGRGIAVPSLSTDKDLNPRSVTVGVPTTIGAYEIAMPITAPDDMVMTPATPVIGTPTVFTSAGRKIAEINWTGASVPTTLTAKYYPGVTPPSPNTTPNINSYIDIAATPSTGASYTIKTYYTTAEANGIANANLGIIKRDGASPWNFASANNSTADADGKFVTSNVLSSFSQFSLSGDINPLGVSLVSFTGVQKGKVNQLQWKTISETNNSGFELQRSADGRSFDMLGFIASKATNGTTTAELNYLYNDAMPLTGNNYYRLKQIDNSGKITYSNIVLLNSASGDRLQISELYPNPADRMISMNLSAAKDEHIAYSIMDITGKVIMHAEANITKGENTLNWNIASFATGNYLIRITTDAGSITRKFSKN